MRTLSAALTAAQRDLGIDALFKIQLTYGANDDTYEEDRILSIDHVEEPDHQEATVVLDNSDLAVTPDYRGYKGVISYGLAPPRSSNYSACAPLWVISQEEHSSEELLTVTLTLKGIPDLMAEDRASEQYLQESTDTQTVKTLLTAVVAATLAPFDHCTAYTATFDSEDSLIDTFPPADSFAINLNETRLEIIKRLLFYCKAVMRVEADGAVHFFVPVIDGTTWVTATAYSLNDYVQPVTPNNNFTYRCTTAGTTGGSEPAWPTVAGNTVADGTVVWTAVGFHYEYKVDVSDTHPLFAKVNRKRIVQPNYIEVSSSPESDEPRYTGFAEDTDSSDLTAMEKREHYYERLASDAQATAIAKAILQAYQFKAQKGSASVPINVGQEVYDYVKFTDSRQGDVRIGNVGYLQRIVKDGDWLMYLSLGDVRQGGFPELFPEISPGEVTPMEGGPIKPTLGNLAQSLNGVVTYFGALIRKQGEWLQRLAGNQMFIHDDVAMLKSGMVSTTQLQGVMDSLHVKKRLRIPVGTDNPAVPDVTYEYYMGVIPGTFTFAHGVNWRAQTFRSPYRHIIKGVKLRLARHGTPGTATVSIKAVDGSGHPTGSDLVSATFNAATLIVGDVSPITGELKDIPFTSTVELVANTEYAIVLRLSGGDVSNRVDWLTTAGGDPYPPGKAWTSSNSGSTWTGGDENYFEEYGQMAGYLWVEGATLHYGNQIGLEQIFPGVNAIVSYQDEVVTNEDKVVYN